MDVLTHRYLDRTKSEIKYHQERSYANKLALHRDMAELLRQRESELRYRTLLLCVSLLQTLELQPTDK